MCGITGVYHLSGQRENPEVIRNMAERIAHRGPNGEGYFHAEGISLAHKRLAILDLSDRGQQPMFSSDQRWVVVFNGCIYNYKELRAELKAKGHHFQSQTDTEVICEGLAEYGPEFFQRLNGMFAIGAWNQDDRCLYLSRDRYGVKPLYYWFNQRTLIFASEIKSIIAHPLVKTELDPEALQEYFTFQNLFTFRTLFRNITLLPPANTVKIDPFSQYVKHESWWDYDFTEPDNNMSFEDAVHETERLFHNAVQRQLISDVPVGAYLSGGMDSGSIASVASGTLNRLTTFTCGFDMSEVTGVEANYDERRDAELMANHLKTEHYEQVLNAGDLRWALPKVVWHLEDLKVGMSYPNYYISRLASKFVRVCLQGTGGDELFGGYPWRYYRIFQSVSQEAFFNQYYNFWQRLVPDQDRSTLFTSEIQRQISANEPREIFERVFTFNQSLKYDKPEDHIANCLYFEAKTFLPGLLIVGDKLSMANGLEERFPFLDNDLVNFAQKVPVRHKLGNLEQMIRVNENEPGDKLRKYGEFNDGKNVLRKAMMNHIPDRILNRKKQGFSAPDESWYRGENSAYIRDLLLHEDTVSSSFINRDYMHRIVREHTELKMNHRLLIWSFMNFEWWCRIYLKGQQIESYVS